MEDSWLEPNASEDWVEVIDPEGDSLGFLLGREAAHQDLTIQTIETPERYLTDPWVLYHAQLAYERGIVTRGQDLSEVQVVLLASNIIKRREQEKAERERTFEERFFTSNPEGYRAWKEHEDRKEETDGDTAGIEQRAPRSIEEFLSTLAAFDAEGPLDSDKGREKAEGWLSSFLDDSELDQMSEE